MMQTEQLNAGTIDEVAVGIQVIQPRVGGGVFAGVEHSGYLARGCLCGRDERVDEGGFAHAGLPDQNAGVALQIRQQRRYILLGREFEYAVTDLSIGCELGAGSFDLRQIALVQNDEGLQFLVMRCEKATRQQFIVERGFGGNHDDDLGDVCGDEFLLESIGAVEQGRTRCDAIDDSLVGAGSFDFNCVAACDLALLAARHAFQYLSTRQLCQIVSPIGGDDQSAQFFGQSLNSASTFAAQMKSFSDSPPMAWVEYSTRHWL